MNGEAVFEFRRGSPAGRRAAGARRTDQRAGFRSLSRIVLGARRRFPATSSSWTTYPATSAHEGPCAHRGRGHTLGLSAALQSRPQSAARCGEMIPNCLKEGPPAFPGWLQKFERGAHEASPAPADAIKKTAQLQTSAFTRNAPLLSAAKRKSAACISES